MNNISEGIVKKQKELEEIQRDIDRLKEERDNLKDIAKKYEELGNKRNKLLSVKKKKQKALNTVINFLKTFDDHYLKEAYPLFAENKQAEENPVQEQEVAV